MILLVPLVCYGSPTPACTADSLFNYINLVGGCYVGNALLSNFSYSVSGNGSSLAPTASQVTITPSSSGDLFGQLDITANPLFSLIGPAGGQGVNSYNAFLSFTITAAPGFGITNIGLSATGRDETGSAGKIIETLSNGVQLQVSGFPTTSTTITDPGTPFSPVSTLDTTKKIQLSNGQLQGNEFTLITQSITLVTPEPVSFYLVGLAGAGLLILRRRQRS